MIVSVNGLQVGRSEWVGHDPLGLVKKRLLTGIQDRIALSGARGERNKPYVEENTYAVTNVSRGLDTFIIETKCWSVLIS